MKRMNNRGFAISTMLYGLLIIIVLILGMILSIMAFNRKNSKDFTNRIVDKLENNKASILCKRATTLHMEDCNINKPNTSWCSGIQSLGQIGTKGTLTAGDAFDCDVNGDGVYDSNTERFYYLRDMNSKVTAMIFYSNVEYGVPKVTGKIVYDNIETPTNGPREAIKYLPTSTQWSNVNLVNPVRNILDANNSIIKSDFRYQGYAARIPCYKDIEELINKNGGTWNIFPTNLYLAENLSSTPIDGDDVLGYWLEDLFYNNRNVCVMFMSTAGFYGHYYSLNAFGVRPVIEVPKNRIDY